MNKFFASSRPRDRKAIKLKIKLNFLSPINRSGKSFTVEKALSIFWSSNVSTFPWNNNIEHSCFPPPPVNVHLVNLIFYGARRLYISHSMTPLQHHRENTLKILIDNVAESISEREHKGTIIVEALGLCSWLFTRNAIMILQREN